MSKSRERIQVLGRLIRSIARAHFDLVPVPPSSIVLCDGCGIRVERCQCEATDGSARLKVLSV